MALSDVITAALEKIQFIAKTETVVGEPIVAGNVTLIPVSKVSVGFAAGGAGKDEKSGSGAGTGGGITVTPVAFISIIGESVQVLTMTPSDPMLNKVLSYAPEIFSKIQKYLKKKDEVKDDPKKE